MRPDKAAIHDVFAPTITISVINVSDSTGRSQLLVVTTQRPWCHVAEKHDRVDTGQTTDAHDDDHHDNNNNNNNKHQSNLGKAESLLVSILQVAAATCNCEFWPGDSTPQISPSLGASDPQLTQCIDGPHKCTCQMASKSVEWFKQRAVHECDRRQTDYVMEKRVVIGRIACARRIPPNNNNDNNTICYNTLQSGSLQGARKR